MNIILIMEQVKGTQPAYCNRKIRGQYIKREGGCRSWVFLGGGGAGDGGVREGAALFGHVLWYICTE
jgi:hypothetical protein